MTSALTSPFHGLPIDEAVPLAMEVQGVSRSSILQGRRKIRFQPQTGTTANPGSIVQFVLSDSTGLLDVNSMVLSATVQVSGADPANPAVMDDGPAFCRRIQVLANGSLVEDLDNAHRATNLELLSCIGQDFYNSEGAFMNYWKFNNSLGKGQTANANASYHKNDVAGKLPNWAYDMSGNGIQCAWPLGLIAPSLRCNKYWPLRSMGELVLQITCANASEALFAPGQGAYSPTYALKDIFLECDIVVPLPQYAQLLDQVTQMPSEPGLVLPVETILSSQGQSIPAGTGTASAQLTESAIIVSRATTNLRQVVFAVQPTAGINNYVYPSVSCFPDAGCGAYQVRIGSLYFPSQPANSIGRLAMMTYGGFGEPASTDKQSVWNIDNYTQTTNLAGTAVYYNQPNAGGVLDGTLATYTARRFLFADFAPKAYCFDSYKNTSDPLDADGVSIVGQAGSQLVNIVRLNNPEAVTPIVLLKATKYLHLKDGGLRVVGA